jgi:hypothetical protein
MLSANQLGDATLFCLLAEGEARRIQLARRQVRL